MKNIMETCFDNRVLQQVLKYSLDMICTINHEGKFTHVSDACKPILGYSPEEMVGRFYLDFVYVLDRNRTLKIIRALLKGNKTTSFENSYIGKTGELIQITWSAVWSETEKMMICVGRDATEQKLSGQRLREKDELHEALIENGSDMLALLDADGCFISSSGSTFRDLGYSSEQLQGKFAFSLVHPEDIAKAQAALEQLLTSHKVTIAEYRFKSVAGEWRWLETIGSNQLQNPAIKALVLSSRDITEWKEHEFKLAESEQQFRNLFENNPDMVLFQTKEGVIRDANPAFLSFLNKTKSAVLYRSIADFLPPAIQSLCNRKLQKAFAGGKVAFVLEADFEQIGPKVLNVTIIPLLIKAEILGFHLVVKDITEINRTQSVIKQQAIRLSTIFESITDPFFSLDKNWNFTYANQAFEKLSGLSQQTLIDKNVWTLYPESVSGIYHQHYCQALETGNTVCFEIFEEYHNKWFEVKVFPSEDGVFVTFSDITEKNTTQEELKKLSLVASKTDNGIIIIDAEGQTEWVNEGFTKLTEYTLGEAAGKKLEELLKSNNTDVVALQAMTEKMEQAIPFSEEIIFFKKSGERIWLALDITPVADELGNVTRIIVILADVSFRKEAEANQVKMTQDLYKHNRDLEQFTYMVSHNLRAPVANALGLIDLIRKEDKDSDVFYNSFTYLKTSIVQIDTVLQDVNNILSIRDKKDVFDKEQVAVGEVCSQAIHDLHELLQLCCGKVNLNIMRGPFVNANRAYLYSIFYNLISNSIKYRSEERLLQIDVKCTGSPGRGTLISYTDNGSGFDLNKAGSNVFKLYKRFHTNKEGRGIGLYLIKTHVETMGGHIEVKSTVNVGTRFLIYLK